LAKHTGDQINFLKEVMMVF